MEEIDISELLKYFKSKIGLLIVITSGICILCVMYSILIQKPMYSSNTTVILGGSSETITQNDITINKNLVNTYAEIVKSRRVLEQVTNELSLDLSYTELNNLITVQPVSNTEIIKIIVNSEDSLEAMNIANSTAYYFSKEVKELYNMNNVNILDSAIEANEPYNINIPKQLCIYLIVGIITACGIIFIIFYFDRTIKSVEQVEQIIKLPILGSIEDFDSKRGRKI